MSMNTTRNTKYDIRGTQLVQISDDGHEFHSSHKMTPLQEKDQEVGDETSRQVMLYRYPIKKQSNSSRDSCLYVLLLSNI